MCRAKSGLCLSTGTINPLGLERNNLLLENSLANLHRHKVVERKTPCCSPSQDCHRRAISPMFQPETSPRGYQEQLPRPPSDWETLLPKGHGTHGMQGKSILQLHKTYMGCLGE